ncbi:hypothetical protein ACFVZC_18295 [Streptomyces marokkonensis]|uniref:Transcriptional regulator n=1 Tax=Streptomyces marokkonensis TaxID=324855 RepID=A0ABW6Q879_9ACTN
MTSSNGWSRIRSWTGRYGDLLAVLPDLLATAHARIRERVDIDYARLSACYSLTAQVLVKIGRYDQARLTADRANLYADLSGSPLASAAAARELGIVLRHQNQAHTAQRLVLKAAASIEVTGLHTQAQAAAYAQLLCTTSYTAARAGDRDQALAMIGSPGPAQYAGDRRRAAPLASSGQVAFASWLVRSSSASTEPEPGRARFGPLPRLPPRTGDSGWGGACGLNRRP